jgi:uncharacterized protein
MIRNAARGGGRVFVGFSGGVDSSLLLWETVQTLGPQRVTAVTATAPTSLEDEEYAAREFASALSVEHLVIPTGECNDPAFMSNPVSRCYTCKRIRYGMLRNLAERNAGSVVFDGTQSDDDLSERPGMRALAELEIVTPLAEAGIGKDDVRKLLKAAGFPQLAEKRAQPCLATRIPTGQRITLVALDTVRRGESFLRGLGLSTVRLRHHDTVARIVTDSEGITRILSEVEFREQIARSLKDLGYEHVTLDLCEYGKG